MTGISLKKKKVEISWKKTGEANVKKVFNIKGVGVIAGCYVSDGVVGNSYKAACIRNDECVGEGKISSLQREKKHVKEVHSGYECGFVTEGFREWQVDDVVHFFKEVKVGEDS